MNPSGMARGYHKTAHEARIATDQSVRQGEVRLLEWLGLYLVMPSGGHKKDDLALVEDRGDDGDVRQVAAARQLRVVADQHVALLNALILARALCVIPQLHY